MGHVVAWGDAIVIADGSKGVSHGGVNEGRGRGGGVSRDGCHAGLALLVWVRNAFTLCSAEMAAWLPPRCHALIRRHTIILNAPISI